MSIRYANDSDYDFIKIKDKHLPKELILGKIVAKELIILENDENERIGWLRYGYFWDNIPFMNMLFIDQEYRSKGWGRDLVHFWENEMKSKGFNLVMTSTQTDENAQHFYRKLNYKEAGCLILESQAMEIIFTKDI
ncbi:GNAT family N-acetyltransferase [Pseudoneobacillus sp. C159]